MVAVRLYITKIKLLRKNTIGNHYYNIAHIETLCSLTRNRLLGMFFENPYNISRS